MIFEEFYAHSSCSNSIYHSPRRLPGLRLVPRFPERREPDGFERINRSKINSRRNKVCYLIGSTFDLSSLNLNYVRACWLCGPVPGAATILIKILRFPVRSLIKSNKRSCSWNINYRQIRCLLARSLRGSFGSCSRYDRPSNVPANRRRLGEKRRKRGTRRKKKTGTVSARCNERKQLTVMKITVKIVLDGVVTPL